MEAMFARQVQDAIEQNAMIVAGETVLVAVSGGADSMALLCVLWALRERLDVGIVAAHYEHGIRGEASRQDARFVQEYCAAQGIPCRVGAGDVPAMARVWRCGMEDAARRCRYAFLEESAAAVGAGKIALAHQQEDQAETLLLHLVHGCGLDGLAGMRPVQGNRIRPLLDISRAVLEAYLREQGIPFCEDATNRDTAHARNLLRHRVFPVLREMNPRVCEAMSRTAGQAAQAAATLRAGAGVLLEGRVRATPYGGFWHVEGICPTREAVRLLARKLGAPEMDARTSGVLQGLAPGQSMNLLEGWRAQRTEKRLHLLREDVFTPEWTEEDFIREPGSASDLGDGIREQAFDADALAGAVFRSRQEGDRFAPLGATGTQKLKQTLRDAGVDRPHRDMLPLLCKDDRVLWIVGVKPSRDAAVHEGTRKVVKIRYTGALPWEISSNGGEHDD